MRKGKKLELYIAEKLKEIGDKYARPTRASGASTEIGDVYNKYFFVECKERDKKNIVIPINVVNKLKNKIPIHTEKEWFIAYRNSEGKTFIITECDVFFRILRRTYEEERKR